MTGAKESFDVERRWLLTLKRLAGFILNLGLHGLEPCRWNISSAYKHTAKDTKTIATALATL